MAPDLLVQLMAGYQRPEDLTAPDGLLNQLKKALIERAMQAEMTTILVTAPPDDQPNRRNGQSTKTVRTDDGPIDVAVPRDRDGSFEPQLIGKHQRHFNGFDDKIVSITRAAYCAVSRTPSRAAPSHFTRQIRSRPSIAYSGKPSNTGRFA